jgi:hydrogenase maturation protease
MAKLVHFSIGFDASTQKSRGFLRLLAWHSYCCIVGSGRGARDHSRRTRRASHAMKTVIIGLGNPVLTDDGVGIHVAKLLKASLPSGLGVTVHVAGPNGNKLADAMAGFDKVILVDALSTGQNPPGTVVHFSAEDLQQSAKATPVHDRDLQTVLGLAASTGTSGPKVIEAWGVEIGDATNFGVYPSPAVRAAVPHIVSEICRSAQRAATPDLNHITGSSLDV